MMMIATKAVKPHYSKGGHWRPTLPHQVCERCLNVYTSHKHGQRFCSRKCAGDHRKSLTLIKTKTCKECASQFEIRSGAHQCRNAEREYCSRACSNKARGFGPSQSNLCQICGTGFIIAAAKVRSGKGKYCSITCKRIGSAAIKINKNCINCGKSFRVSPSRGSELLCSSICSATYYQRDRSWRWKGGVVQQNKRQYRRIDRQGYEAKYEGEHRLIVEREIGRNMMRGEVVICIDSNHKNLDPGNLFIFPNLKEHGLAQGGAIEWPTRSNLQDYRVYGYIRPDVIIILHEWEQGKRKSTKSHRMISRHPQAEEIIKRRQAGASQRELAAEFGCSLSGMAETIKNRL